MNARSAKLSEKNTPKQQRLGTGLSTSSKPAARLHESRTRDESITATWEHEERGRRGRAGTGRWAGHEGQTRKRRTERGCRRNHPLEKLL